MASEAWQRKEGKNAKGGLNEKGRKSYEKANPGSDLKAPVKSGDNPRRASFLARMGNMPGPERDKDLCTLGVLGLRQMLAQKQKQSPSVIRERTSNGFSR